MNAIDTNLLVYAVSADQPGKGEMAMRLLDRLGADDTVLLWQVAVELGTVLSRLEAAGRLRRAANEVVTLYRARFPLILPSADVLELGLQIHRSLRVSDWDALLLAACVEAGVTRLYSEDMPSQPVIEGVAVVNPFV
jgi:predicted nucleic acid-binding protein